MKGHLWSYASCVPHRDLKQCFINWSTVRPFRTTVPCCCFMSSLLCTVLSPSCAVMNSEAVCMFPPPPPPLSVTAVIQRPHAAAAMLMIPFECCVESRWATLQTRTSPFAIADCVNCALSELCSLFLSLLIFSSLLPSLLLGCFVGMTKSWACRTKN